jgi:hypothetical protein
LPDLLEARLALLLCEISPPFFSQSFFHPHSTSESLLENIDQHFSPAFSSAALTTQTSLW